MKYDLNEPDGRWKAVSLMGGLLALAGIMPLHDFYEEWHDERYAKRSEVMMLAQATRFEEQIQIAQQTADATSRKVDDLAASVNSIQISTTIAAISSLKMELSRHEYNKENTQAWRDERDKLVVQIDRAEEYKQCLIENRRNCDIFKPW